MANLNDANAAPVTERQAPRPKPVTRGPQSLWRHSDFAKLWGGETLSQVGSQVTEVALPLTAILLLNADAKTVGMLFAVLNAPVLISVLAGAWVEGRDSRRIMTTAHLMRAVLVAAIPVAYLFGVLSISLLFAVAFVLGCLTAVFNIVYISFLPALVHESQLVNANAKLEATYTVSQIGGPGLGGVLVQLFAAPLALLVDGVTYLLAGLLSSQITAGRPADRESDQVSALSSIRRSVGFILGHRVLRPLVLQSASYNLFASAILVLYLLFGTRELGLSPGVLGVLLALGSAGGLIGAVVAARAARALGTGIVMVSSMLLCSIGLGLVPAAGGSTVVASGILLLGLVLNGFGLALFNVHSLAIRAQVIAVDQLGTVTGGFQTLSSGSVPLSGVLAAALGSLFGTRVAIAMCASCLLLASVGFTVSSMRTFGRERLADTSMKEESCGF